MSSCKASWHKPTEDYYKPSSYSQSNSRYPNLKFPKDENPTCSVAVIRFAVVVPRAAQRRRTHQKLYDWIIPIPCDPCCKTFSGKVVYLDIFASLCQPCRAEITHYPALQDFFTDNDIVCLFASVDSDKAGCDQCVELLNEAGLQGYFVTYFAPEGRTAGQFANELGALFCDTDQAGKIVRISVPRPATSSSTGRGKSRSAMQNGRATVRS